jgi:glycosyltransferase involved in cell wall biosynthesis
MAEAARSPFNVAVVICSRDRPQLLEEALSALKPFLRDHDELIVVDSASHGDATIAVAKAAGLPVVRCDRPGLSRARNAGVRATGAPILAFYDDDCIPEAGWITALEAAFSDETVGFVSGRVLPDRRDPVLVSVVVDEDPRHFDASDPFPLLGTGANMAFRRSAIEGIGGFDELLGAGARFPAAEEQDAFWRAIREGWTGRYEPAAVVRHRQWRSRTRALRLFVSYGRGEGAFIAKVARLEGRSLVRVARERFVRDGLGRAWRNLRIGYEYGTLTELLQAYGALVGMLQSRSISLTDARYAGGT